MEKQICPQFSLQKKRPLVKMCPPKKDASSNFQFKFDESYLKFYQSFTLKKKNKWQTLTTIFLCFSGMEKECSLFGMENLECQYLMQLK